VVAVGVGTAVAGDNGVAAGDASTLATGAGGKERPVPPKRKSSRMIMIARIRATIPLNRS
jgi:hypothetical protein